LQVLWALEPEVASKEQVVDGYLRQEKSRFVLLSCVEDFSEMKSSQRHSWQARDDCPREPTKEVGVDKVTILDCLENQRSCLTTQYEAPPLWNPKASFVKSGHDESQMVGQGLCRSIEEALEWLTDYACGEERVLYYLMIPRGRSRRSTGRRRKEVCAYRDGEGLLLQRT
jgi:hypothetical protein